MIVVGSIFLLLAFVGRFGAYIELPHNRQKIAGGVGIIFLSFGIALSALPFATEINVGEKKEKNTDVSYRKINNTNYPTISNKNIGDKISTTKLKELANEDLLIKALNTIKGGDCPGSLFYSNLRNACVEYLEVMMHDFNRKGSIKSADLIRVQEGQFGEVEVYQVYFDNGEMEWQINRGPDGRLLTLWSPPVQ